MLTREVDTLVDLIVGVEFRFGLFLILGLGRQKLLFFEVFLDQFLIWSILNFCRVVFLLALLKQLTKELLVRMLHQIEFMHYGSLSDGYQLGLNQGELLEKFVLGLGVWLGFQRFCRHFTLRE